ncbi:hypothetical protein BU17DRAFT_78947 [Hysterangium stoloniferum]|nr:hypothetical protein BU17DRAFT_78947 [Hysterangium stoloniferum]
MDIAAIVAKVAGNAVPLFSVREVGAYKTWSVVVILPSTCVMDEEGGHSSKSRVTLSPVPAPDSFSGPVLPRLTPPSPVRKPPPSQSMLPRSQPFPPSRCQKAIFATREAVVVTPSFARRSFVITSIDDPSVQSKVAATSDNGPAPSVE